jgi:glutamine amidotransferase|tara:strand:+ start:234 stop:518 length:285 start_codon:yes stop_codon:yes gene_type:complete
MKAIRIIPRLDVKGVNWLKATVLRDIFPGDYVCFVHSFVVIPTDPACIIAEINYGLNNFCSVILKDNIIGCQFHPEKSGIVGLKIYRNFILYCE